MAGEYLAAMGLKRGTDPSDLFGIRIGCGIAAPACGLADKGTDGNIGAIAGEGVRDRKSLTGQTTGNDGRFAGKWCHHQLGLITIIPSAAASSATHDRSLRDPVRSH